jgi:quinol monooxygenase YgiN
MTPQPVTVLVAYQAQPGAAEIAVRELTELIGTVVAKEPACRGIQLYQDPGDPSRILLWEEWADRAEYVGPHMQTPHLTAFIERAAGFLVGPPDISFWRWRAGQRRT